MQLYMKQKVFSFLTRFNIFDANEQTVYQVEGELSFGTRLHVFDRNGNEVAMICQKLLSFRPRYELDVYGKQPAMIVKQFSFLNSRFEIEGWDWAAEGDFTNHEFSIGDQEGLLMSVSKAWFTWGDSYQLDLADRADPLCCVCALLAMDMAIAASQHNNLSAMGNQ